nr:hypothetical protein [Staphylococcus sp. KG4-3]MDW8561508.1 hypothetical protein [Staphylococcus sp. KG4-3]
MHYENTGVQYATPEVYKREQKPLYNPKSSQHVEITKRSGTNSYM